MRKRKRRRKKKKKARRELGKAWGRAEDRRRAENLKFEKKKQKTDEEEKEKKREEMPSSEEETGLTGREDDERETKTKVLQVGPGVKRRKKLSPQS